MRGNKEEEGGDRRGVAWESCEVKCDTIESAIM